MRRLLLAAILIFAVDLAYAAEVVVGFPLSKQPYFLPFKQSGLAYDTIKAAFGARGHQVRPLFVSSRQIERLLTDDSRADCVPMISPGREHGWTAAKSAHLLHDVVATMPGLDITSLEDLATKRVLGYAGALLYLGEDFRAVMKDNPRYREIGNHRAQVRLLLHGVVDAIVADRLLISWYLDYLFQEGLKNVEVLYHDLGAPIEHSFVCRDPALAAEFSVGLEQILTDGSLQEILSRYRGAQADSVLLPLQGDSAKPPGTDAMPAGSDVKAATSLQVPSSNEIPAKGLRTEE